MSEWISVKERLPKQGDDVLVVTDFGIRVVAWFTGSSNRWRVAWTDHLLESEVVYWMPLPPSPEEG